MLKSKWNWLTVPARLLAGAVVVLSLLGSVGSSPRTAMAQGAKGGAGEAGPAQSVVAGKGANQPPVLSDAERQRLQNHENDHENDPVTPPGPGAANTRSGPPTVPETQVLPANAGPGSGSAAPGTFYNFANSDLGAGAGSLIAEPSGATNGPLVFQTWNWYAGLSTDNGATWGYYNPSTFFPASYGGFCCDQVVIYDRSRDMMIWVLQYGDDVNGNNILRLAISRGRSELGSGQWWYWDITPQLATGAATGTDFDQPKLALSSNDLYIEVTQYGASPGSIIMRIGLDDLHDLGSIGWLWYGPGLFSPGFTQGATTTMYFAAHVDTSTLRVFTWPESVSWTGITTNDVSHTAYPQNFPYSCPRTGGSGTSDWCQRRSFGGGWAHSDRVFAGWVSKGVIGFMWDASQGAGGFGTFNYPYVHVVRVNQGTYALINEPIMFNSTLAFSWVTVSPNARGDIAGTVMWGGGSSGYYENCADFVWDADTVSPPNPWEIYSATTSNNDPNDTLSGDYLAARMSGRNPFLWNATCYALVDGTDNAHIHTYYLELGRGRDQFRKTRTDFNVDGTTDLSVWRPSTGVWYVKNQFNTTWGSLGDVPVTADYNGDGRSDVAVWRPSTGIWYVQGQFNSAWGTSGDVPVPGDYNGDGKADVAVWRPSTGTWYVKGISTHVWGAAGDIPVPGDYNGDGITDEAVFRPSTGTWYIRGIGNFAWGTSGDFPVQADYNNDGLTDIAVWRPSTGVWYVRGLFTATWGVSTDIPVPGDYNADGAAEVAIWRPSTATWWVKGLFTSTWGGATDFPLVAPDTNGDGDPYQ